MSVLSSLVTAVFEVFLLICDKWNINYDCILETFQRGSDYRFMLTGLDSPESFVDHFTGSTPCCPMPCLVGFFPLCFRSVCFVREMRKKNIAESWELYCELLCSSAPFLVVFEQHNLWDVKEGMGRLGMVEHFYKSWAISASAAPRKWQGKMFAAPCPYTVRRDQLLYL